MFQNITIYSNVIRFSNSDFKFILPSENVHLAMKLAIKGHHKTEVCRNFKENTVKS